MTNTVALGRGRIMLGDCLERMSEVPDQSVDLVLADLPYGTTACAWDTIIPFAPLWAHYWRVLKPVGAVVLTAAQPFTSALVMSQIERFKYDWIWRKEKGTGHLNAKRMPMRSHEHVCIFGMPKYNPQMTIGVPYGNKRGHNASTYGKHEEFNNPSDGLRYPTSVLEFNSTGRGGIHPTQKPVELFEYLIKTYTDPGAVVLDNVAGSGTTAIAAENTGRNWVCIEKDPVYFNVALARIANRVMLDH